MSERRMRYVHRDPIPRWLGVDRGLDWKLVTGDAARIKATADRIRPHMAAEWV
jgi:hypothetical protein